MKQIVCKTYAVLAEADDPLPEAEIDAWAPPEAFCEELSEENRPKLNSSAFSFLCSSCTWWRRSLSSC